MGSQIGIWLELEQAEQATAVLRQVECLFNVLETRLTRFSETSELSLLNERHGQWVPVSNVMWQIVCRALELAEETDGLFDPTILNALELAGYSQSFEQLGMRPPLEDPLHGPSWTRTQTWQANGWRDIMLDRQRQAIRLPENVRLDLGGIGKGYAAQQAVAFLSQWGPCLIDAGGDLVAGDGPRGWPGWPVGVSAPWASDDQNPQEVLRLWLSNRTLATSGIDFRRWKQNGRWHHHLIDPRTGCPAETDALTVSLLARDATRAEAWATAALVAGVEEGLERAEDEGLAAVFIDKSEDLFLTEEMYGLIM